MAFEVPYARTEIYKYSFFPDTIRDWNTFHAAVICWKFWGLCRKIHITCGI